MSQESEDPLADGAGTPAQDDLSGNIGAPEPPVTQNATTTGSDFSNPQPVTILGYSGDEMEPFISRDGQYLFFNDSNDPPNDTTLYYATRINDTTFSFAGEVQGVNTNDVDAVASMDSNDVFYYFSRKQYFNTYLSLYSGTFNNGTVTGVAPIDQNITPDEYGGVNIDSEISPNGQTLYYTDSYLSNIHDRAEPQLSSKIEEAVLTPDGFEEIPDSDAIFANINDADLNYAPTVSADGLTMFFTRADLASPTVSIYVATRSSTSEPFGVPQLVQGITGYVEGPSLSSDGTLLYYHKRLPDGTFQIYVASLTSASTIAPRTLVWSGASDTNFANQQNWNDSTNSLSPAEAPPGAADTAVIIGFGGTIGGNGSAGVLVFGGADTWTLSSTASLVASSGIVVGLGGSATVAVDGGASISSQGGQDAITGSSGGLASVTVDGAGSSWNSSGELVIGNNGAGALTVSNQGTLISGGNTASPGGGIALALGSGSSSTVTVTGTGSAIVNTGQLSIGGGDGVPIGGVASLLIEDGGVVTTNRIAASLVTPAAVIAAASESDGSTVRVDGANSSWQIGGPLLVGDIADGYLSITAGGSVTAAQLDAGVVADSTGNITVSDPGSSLSVTGLLTLGDGDSAKLSILNGATVIAQNTTMGVEFGTTGFVAIEGADSRLLITGNAVLGEAGVGVVQLNSSGALTVGGTMTTAGNSALFQAGGSITAAAVNNNGRVNGNGIFVATNSLTNDGIIFAAQGTYDISSPSIGGTGSLEIDSGSDLQVDGTVENSQTIVFANSTSNTGTLTIDQIDGFTPAVIDGFVNGDSIIVVGTAPLTQSFDSNTDMLTLTDPANNQYVLQFSGLHTAGDFTSAVAVVAPTGTLAASDSIAGATDSNTTIDQTDPSVPDVDADSAVTTTTVDTAITGGDFSNPQPVTILGYSGDAMEPFISRDGQYLFFNNNPAPPDNSDLYYATRINDTTFSFVGPVQGVNTPDVDAIASMDDDDNFYYFSREQYPETGLSLYSGVFNNGTVTDVQPIDQNITVGQFGGVNIDSEISPNGQTLYYTDNFVPDPYNDTTNSWANGQRGWLSAEIEEAVLTPDGFEEIPNSDAIFANINNADLNYAASVSADGLTMFFTRLDLTSHNFGIYVATRATTSDPFGVPQLIQAVTGYVEGPSLSSDGSTLYYHKLTDDGTFQIYEVSLNPADTIAPRTLVWSGATDTDFTNQQNWNDSTNSLSPAGAPPGSADTAVFIGIGGTISGAGTVDTVVFGGANAWTLTATASLVAGSGVKVGLGSSGTLALGAGASISSQGVQDVITGASGQLASVTVDGAGTSWNSAGELVVGNNGAGALTVSNQGTLISGSNPASPGGGIALALGAGSSGTVTVTGTGSAIVNTGQLSIGGGEGVPTGGLASLSIEAGGTVTTSRAAASSVAPGASIATAPGSEGSTVRVDGANSSWQIAGPLLVGDIADGYLSITAGGSVSAGLLDAGVITGSTGNLSVSDPGSELSVTGPLTLADGDSAQLSILNGATVLAQNATLGVGSATTGFIDIEGTGSGLLVTGDMVLGEAGTGAIRVTSGAAVSIGGDMTIGATSALLYAGGSIAAASVINSGYVQGFGSLVATVSLTNNGTYFAIDGNYVIDTPAIDGIGTLEVDSTGNLEIDGAVQNDQTIAFTNSIANSGTLTIGQIGGFMPAVIEGFVSGDSIIVQGVASLTQSFDSDTDRLTLTDSMDNHYTLQFAGVHTADDFAGAVGTAPCFLAGTRIDTRRGEVAVEDLEPGDLIRVVIGETWAPVIWLGHRRIDCRIHTRPDLVWPVRIRAHAFGTGWPRRDLWLSPDHAVFINEVLVPVKHLINGGAIAQIPMDVVDYYHVELPRHSVLLADGLPAESYLDTGERRNFANVGASMTPDADRASRAWEGEACAPLIIMGPVLDTIRRRLGDTDCTTLLNAKGTGLSVYRAHDRHPTIQHGQDGVGFF